MLHRSKPHLTEGGIAGSVLTSGSKGPVAVLQQGPTNPPSAAPQAPTSLPGDGPVAHSRLSTRSSLGGRALHSSATDSRAPCAATARRHLSRHGLMELTGAEILIRCLQEEGVDYVFGYPGG